MTRNHNSTLRATVLIYISLWTLDQHVTILQPRVKEDGSVRKDYNLQMFQHVIVLTLEKQEVSYYVPDVLQKSRERISKAPRTMDKLSMP